MLVKFWLTVLSLAVATSSNILTVSNPVDVMNCASAIPCQRTTITTTTSNLPTIATTTPIYSKAACKNCPQPDCTMVSNGTTFSYFNHCKLFYQCIDGVAEVCVCPNGFWYDRTISKCMLCELVLNCEANKD